MSWEELRQKYNYQKLLNLISQNDFLWLSFFVVFALFAVKILFVHHKERKEEI